jgi:hypothetical protein
MERKMAVFNEFKEIRIVATGFTRPGSHTAEDEVNRLIQEGWELLETYTTCYGHTPPLSFQQEAHFVMGRRNGRCPVQPVAASSAAG